MLGQIHLERSNADGAIAAFQTAINRGGDQNLINPLLNLNHKVPGTQLELLLKYNNWVI